MSARLPSTASLLEIGLGAALAGLLVGLGLLVTGWVSGGARRARGRGQEAPPAGSVPESRHQHTASVSPR